MRRMCGAAVKMAPSGLIGYFGTERADPCHTEMNAPCLVILAAGGSTRFGRPKQLEPVGRNGEAIMDITMRQGFEAGCMEAWLVVRPEHEEDVKARYRRDHRVRIAVQHAPLGTGHAAMVGMKHFRGTCIVANGDDLYGRRSMELAVKHAMEGLSEEHALVAFDLERTLSPHGPVNRAVCLKSDHHLRGITEVRGLRAWPAGEIVDETGLSWPAGTPVSMNLWVMRESFCAVLLDMDRDEPVAPGQERGLPDAVRKALSLGQAFRILRTPDRWCGLTFPGDADLVRRHLAEHP